ncbi:MAG: helicase-related protein, partial [Candidatus Parvarchaeota archaeon]|nr:helicase-related protein [Candidatus Parvarchaeota archaeon]
EIAREQSVNDIIANGLKIIRDTIKSSKSTLIFTNTRETAEMLGSRLNRFLKDSRIEVHHSSLSKEVRTDIENRFKEGKINVVIATSSMELGIDIGNVDMVIQYMSPRQVIKLIQRVGRSNHSQTGISEGKILTINVDDYLESESIDFNRRNGVLEKIEVPKNSFDILCHQIVGCVIDGMNDSEEIYKLIKSSSAYSSLRVEDFRRSLRFLTDHFMLRDYDGRLVRTRKGLIFYVSNISSIPDTKTFIVVDSQLNKRIGTLDEEFIAEHGSPKTAFVMKGETWKIVSIEGRKVNAVRSESSLGAIPAWEGELMPVHRFVAEKAAELRKEYVGKFSVLKEQDSDFMMPDGKKMVIERIQDYIIIHSTFGNKINEGLSYIIGEELSERIGESVLSKVDPYRIIIKTMLPLDEIKGMITRVENVEETLRRNLRKTSLYTYRFINVAKRFGVIDRSADYTKSYIRKLMEIFKDTIVDEEVYNEIFRDKIDLDGVKDVIDRLKEGQIEIYVNNDKASPLSYEGLEATYGGSVIRPSEARKTLRELVESRLNETRLYLQCLNCGNRIGELYAADTDDLKCKRCGAKLIAFYKLKYKEVYDPIIKKFLKKEPLDKTEENIMEGIKQNAALYLAYGKKACLVGSAYGVGPRTASRILSMYARDEELMIDKVIEAEKNYIETKDYWNN